MNINEATLPMKTIHLHGSLAKFGKSFELAVNSPAMATRALCALLGHKFSQVIRNGRFHIVLGSMRAKVKKDVGEDEVLMGTSAKHIHIIPVVEGSSGALRVVIGVVMMVVGFYTGQTWLIQLGAGMALGGVAAMLTPTPKTSGPASNVAQNASFLFNGAVNTVAQGGPIPIVYGRFRTGSTIISAGLETAEIPTADAGTGSPPSVGTPPDGTVALPLTSLVAKN